MSTHTTTFCNVSEYHQALNLCALPFMASRTHGALLLSGVPQNTRNVHAFAACQASRNRDPHEWQERAYSWFRAANPSYQP